MKKIIDIHGQQDNQTILESSSHIKFLDDFIGRNIVETKKRISKNIIDMYKIKERTKKKIYGDDKEKQKRKVDFITIPIKMKLKKQIYMKVKKKS